MIEPGRIAEATAGETAPQIPATLGAIANAGPEALHTLAWPAPFSDIVAPLADVYRRYVEATVRIADPETRAIVILGRPMMPILTLVQWAIWTAAAESVGQELIGDRCFDYLAGRVADGHGIELSGTATEQHAISQWLWPRRMARTFSWTPVQRLAKAMIRPDGVALMHNALLRSFLSSSPKAVRNAYDADFDLVDAEVDTAFVRRNDANDLASHMASVLTESIVLPHPIGRRLRVALQEILRTNYEESVQALARIRNSKSVPKNLYTGTGSKWVSRLLGIEVARRGGQVVRCDHGGSLVLLDTPDSTAINELAVSTQFVVATEAAADSSNFQEANQRISKLSTCLVVGLQGDPTFDVGPAAFNRSTPRQKRRAMYISTVYYGMRQVSPPTVPAPLYLDWQLRLVSMLKALPLDVVCKLHPEGLRAPADLELSRLAAVDHRKFEEAVSEADVLIYDFPATTTLAIGLCTDRPIVLIDHGTMRFTHSIRPMLEQRCQIVSAGPDERNRLVVDPQRLEYAICGGADEADPSYFRHLFLGETLSQRQSVVKKPIS